MPCMCGDPYCGSCGPAQGNYRCYNCGKWAMDGGCDKPEECNKALEESAKAEAEWEERMARDSRDVSDAEFWNTP